MRTLLTFLLVFMSSAYASAAGMAVPGATPEALVHDCRVTAELSVELLKMKVKNTEPEKMEEASNKFLESKGYRGALGETGFISRFYTGMALQQGKELEQMMAELSGEDFELMVEDHNILCVKSVFGGDGGSDKLGAGAEHGNMGGQDGLPAKP